MNVQIDVTGVYLDTGRMILRPWCESDLDDLYAYARVDGVGQMAGWRPHSSIEESKMILKMFIEGKKTFALVYHGKVIGSLGIEKYCETHYPELTDKRGREIGYVLSKDFWGMGLMPEAVRAVIDWLFQSEKLDFIIVGHFDWNNRSRRVAEKCGFRYIKTVDLETRFDSVEKTHEYILWNPNN